MHLTSKADTCHLTAIDILCQFFDSFFGLFPPVSRILLRPARMRKRKGYSLDTILTTCPS